MSKPVVTLKGKHGQRAPLFDRLEQPNEISVEAEQRHRLQSGQALLRSIEREVSNLLNTRCAFSPAALQKRERTVLEYGIPDFAHFSLADEDQQRALVETIRGAIAAYEPRLSSITVQLVRVEPRGQRIVLNVSGKIRVGDTVEPVMFPVALNNYEGTGPRHG